MGPCGQDAVVLGRYLRDAGGLSVDPSRLKRQLREYEKERSGRAMPVTIESYFRGALLQIESELVGGRL